MAAKNKVPQVSEDILDLFTNQDTSEAMDTDHTHGWQPISTNQAKC
jgi:hypothetical protein